MTYPLIILGAGASYDFSIEGKIAPLTKELTDDKFLHNDLLEKYQGASNLLSDMVYQVRNGGKNFEDVLTDIKNETKNSQIMYGQFSALEFYLRDLFGRISKPTDSTRRMFLINNYRTLINRINTYCSGALVATFNYDTLFENNLNGLAPQRMRDYTSGQIKIFKLHGSHDWIYINRKKHLYIGIDESHTDYSYCINNPNFLDKLKADKVEPIHVNDLEESGEKHEFAQFPAIAIPLTGKDSYICPPLHIKNLEMMLPSVDRILVVGWRAGDPALLETLKSKLTPDKYKLLVVSNTLEGAKEICKTINEALGADEKNVSARGGGFSGFMQDEISKTFFQ